MTSAAPGLWEELRHDLVALAESFNEATDKTLLIQAEYLVVIGRRTG